MLESINGAILRLWIGIISTIKAKLESTIELSTLLKGLNYDESGNKNTL
jgi:hypothetical protein